MLNFSGSKAQSTSFLNGDCFDVSLVEEEVMGDGI
jgi:hypothetical protein